MPIVLLADNTYPSTVQMDFSNTQLTMVESLGTMAEKINEIAVLVNANEELVDEQGNQIQQFIGTHKTADETAAAALEAWKQAFMTPTFLDLTLTNGWAAAGAAIKVQCFMDASSVVHLRGKLTAGNLTVGTVITQLPLGYRPAQIVLVSPASDVRVVLSITTNNGNVIIESIEAECTYISLDGISFTILS